MKVVPPSPTSTIRLLAYHGTANLGDAIQTAAISRLLGGTLRGVYWHSLAATPPQPGPFVVNGWLGDTPPGAGSLISVRTVTNSHLRVATIGAPISVRSLAS